ncbi:DUF1631 family protein [Curvibacter sp. APW13]|uniref:DUF1631 family protein n=1 Tax=Curvibacter sp. APW13 TaxID=3077236 RepID=UPI0028DDFCD1|nr:DUF1631 family protein [Curvibacter sp. APW13]MDT8991862.1 DUF1631 family protein [Curvibacter sp. APW13]
MLKKYALRRLGVAQDLGGLRPTVQVCLETVLEQSDALLDDVMAGLQAALLGKHSKVAYGQISKEGRAAVETLCANAQEAHGVFAAALRRAFFAGATLPGLAQPAVRFDDFQLLEEDQIDSNIEIALTQQEVQMAVGDVLAPVHAYVGGLMGWQTVQPQLNPLRPECFVYALRETLTQLVDDPLGRNAIMTQSAGLLGLSLRQLYKELVDWLRTAGIEPATPPGATVSGLDGGGRGNSTPVMARTMLTLDKLRRLLSGELSEPSPVANRDTEFSHTLPAAYSALEDLKLMEHMMRRLAEKAHQAPSQLESADAGVSDRTIAEPTEKSPAKRLGAQLGEEVVRLMIDNLEQDYRLLAPVRTSLRALEPVVQKLVRSDARFFSERNHPARQYLDRITHRSLAYSSVDQPGFARFMKTFDNANSVLTGGDGDAAAFDRVLRRLEAGWARDEQEQRQRAEEAARALLHAEQRHLLAQRLAQEFMEKVENKSVPELVISFLRGPWAQVVAESQLRCVAGTEDADGFHSLVDDLIWSVRVKAARRNRSRLVQLVPAMLVKMRQGLTMIDYPSDRIAAFFDELIPFHEQAFDVPRASAEPNGKPAAAEVMSEDGAQGPDTVPASDFGGSESILDMSDYWMSEAEAQDSGYVDEQHSVSDGMELPADALPEPQQWTAQTLHTGAWVDLAMDGEWVRAQLTWASPHRTLFMFISGNGLAHSMSRRTMERLQAQSLIRLVSDGKVLDQALDAVAQAAISNQSDGETPD